MVYCMLAVPVCMCPYWSPHESLWNTPISHVAPLLLSHDFTSKCMPRRDDRAQTLSPLAVLTSINFLFCFVSYVEISTTRYSSNCVCSFLETVHALSNYFILVTHWFNSDVILIPINSSHPTRHMVSIWVWNCRQLLLRMIMIICN